MLKTFINHFKKKAEPKFFYDCKVKSRTTAYGQAVAEEFEQWCGDFYKTWNMRGTNFLLSEQGSIDGNPIRGDSRYGKARLMSASGLHTSPRATATTRPICTASNFSR